MSELELVSDVARHSFNDAPAEPVLQDAVDTASLDIGVVQHQLKRVSAQHGVQVDHSRDALLTDFGKATLQDRYLLPGEQIQDLFARVASA